MTPTPTPTPSDPQAAARDVIAKNLWASVVGNGWTLLECEDEADAILAALESAGLVLAAPDAPSRASGGVVIPTWLAVDALNSVRGRVAEHTRLGQAQWAIRFQNVADGLERAIAAAGDAP